MRVRLRRWSDPLAEKIVTLPEPLWRTFLSTTADGLGILGFVLTVIVALKVGAIERDYMFRGVVPLLAKRLTEHATAVLQHLAVQVPAEQRNLILAELSKAEGPLEAVIVHLKKDHRKPARALLVSIRGYGKASQPVEGQAYQIYCDLQRVISQIDILIEERQWQRQ
jgi:hypothetical protein